MSESSDDLVSFDSIPWERQPGEPHRHYELFAIYRDMGPQRTVAEAVRLWRDDPDASTGQARQWAKKYNWDRRVEIYDDHQDQLARKASANSLQRARQRQARIAAEMQDLFLEWIERFKELPWEKQKRKFDEITLKEIMQTVNYAAQLENEALGEDEDKTEKMLADYIVEAVEERNQQERDEKIIDAKDVSEDEG